MVALAIGDVITGDVVEPDVLVSASPSVGGLLDSLTGSIGISGISARAKPVASPSTSATPSNTVAGTLNSDVPRPLDKDALRSFISSSMPFGWYLVLLLSLFQNLFLCWCRFMYLTGLLFFPPFLVLIIC